MIPVASIWGEAERVLLEHKRNNNGPLNVIQRHNKKNMCYLEVEQANSGCVKQGEINFGNDYQSCIQGRHYFGP